MAELMQTYVAYGTTEASPKGLNMGGFLLGRLADLQVCAHVLDPSQGFRRLTCHALQRGFAGRDLTHGISASSDGPLVMICMYSPKVYR
jgi:hypothetical protein